MNSSTRLYQSLIYFSLSLFLITANAASKSDQAKEKRWEQQIVPSILVGEDIHLKGDGISFLALYAEPTSDQVNGAVILIHGDGVHPAWPDVIDPLRMQLPDNGWHTLSLQMPVLHNDAKDAEYSPLYPEVLGRIQAGVDFLKAKGIHNIVLAAHSGGATMASYYMASHKDPAIKIFAIISGGFNLTSDAYMDSIEHFKKIKDVRIVDIYGSEDVQSVFDLIQKRNVLSIKMHKGQYQQIKVEGANHFYVGKQDALVTALSNNINK